jgi:hypothetical protein
VTNPNHAPKQDAGGSALSAFKVWAQDRYQEYVDQSPYFIAYDAWIAAWTAALAATPTGEEARLRAVTAQWRAKVAPLANLGESNQILAGWINSFADEVEAALTRPTSATPAGTEQGAFEQLIDAARLVDLLSRETGEPCDGFRFREGIASLRDALQKLGRAPYQNTSGLTAPSPASTAPAAECETCKGEGVVISRPAGAGYADDLAEYEPCPDCARPPSTAELSKGAQDKCECILGLYNHRCPIHGLAPAEAPQGERELRQGVEVFVRGTIGLEVSKHLVVVRIACGELDNQYVLVERAALSAPSATPDTESK